MYLKEFRPVSFEQDGKPIIVTSSGLVQGTGTIVSSIPAYSTSSATDRTSIIVDVSSNIDGINAGELSGLFASAATVTNVSLTTNTIERFIAWTFVDLQRITAFKIRTRRFAPSAAMKFYGSVDNVNWEFLELVVFGDTNIEEIYPITNTAAFKYFKLSTEIAEINGGEIKGISFETGDAPAFTTILPNLADSLITTTIDSNLQGTYAFDSADLTEQDVHGNGVVSFKINNIPAITFNAERTIDGTPGNPGNSHFGGYVSTANSIFGGGSINASSYVLSGSYIQSNTGNIKLVDTDNGGVPRDLIFKGAGLTIDGNLYPGGLYVEGTDNTYKAIITTENISQAVAAAGGLTIDDTVPSLTTAYSSSKIQSEIDDFDKIDSYLGCYYKTNSILFDKYIDIDTLLGTDYVNDPSLTAEEIAKLELLDNQLGILAEVDNDIINYVDLKLGLQL